MSIPITLGPTALQQIREDHRRLEAMVRNEAPRSPGDGESAARTTRWGRTCVESAEDYPAAPANTFWVEFGERSFSPDDETGESEEDFVAYDPPMKRLCRTNDGSHVAEDEIVRCELHHGHWWIVVAGAASTGAVMLSNYGTHRLGTDTNTNGIFDTNQPVTLLWQDQSGSLADAGVEVESLKTIRILRKGLYKVTLSIECQQWGYHVDARGGQYELGETVTSSVSSSHSHTVRTRGYTDRPMRVLFELHNDSYSIQRGGRHTLMSVAAGAGYQHVVLVWLISMDEGDDFRVDAMTDVGLSYPATATVKIDGTFTSLLIERIGQQ